MDGNTSNSYRLRGKSRKSHEPSHDSRSSEINNDNSIDGSDSAKKKTLRPGEVRITRAQANKKSKVGVATKQDTSMTKKFHATDILSTVTLSEEEEDDEVDIEMVSSPIKMDNTPTRVLKSCNVNTRVDIILPLTRGVLVKRVTPRKTGISRVLAEVDDENSDAGISVNIKEIEKNKKEGDEEEDGGVDGDEEEEYEEEEKEEWEKEEIEEMEEENLEQEKDGVVQSEEETNGSTYIYHMFPGRKQQISILLSLMGKVSHTPLTLAPYIF